MSTLAKVTGLVQLYPPTPTQPRLHGPLQGAPHQSAGRGPGNSGAEGVGREARRGGGVKVRDERRHRHPLELTGERRREGEDVVHDHVRARLSDRGTGFRGGENDRLVWLQRALAGGERRSRWGRA